MRHVSGWIVTCCSFIFQAAIFITNYKFTFKKCVFCVTISGFFERDFVGNFVNKFSYPSFCKKDKNRHTWTENAMEVWGVDITEGNGTTEAPGTNGRKWNGTDYIWQIYALEVLLFWLWSLHIRTGQAAGAANNRTTLARGEEKAKARRRRTGAKEAAVPRTQTDFHLRPEAFSTSSRWHWCRVSRGRFRLRLREDMVCAWPEDLTGCIWGLVELNRTWIQAISIGLLRFWMSYRFESLREDLSSKLVAELDSVS